MRADDCTVVIPAFNASRTLSTTILSAALLGPCEVVVVDDGSTDGTAETAEALGCRVVHQPNSGAAKARLRGLESIETTYAIYLDADDLLIPEGVAASLEVLRTQAASPSTVGVMASWTAKHVLVHPWQEGISIEGLLVRGRSPGPPGAFVWKAEALREAQKIWPTALQLRHAEDFEQLLRLRRIGNILTHRGVACRYTPVGGKSAANPLADMRATEAIRRHYAESWGVTIQPRTPAQLRVLAGLRSAFSAQCQGKNLRHFYSYASLAIRHPLASLTLARAVRADQRVQ